jgi:hypothetical protein
MPSRATSSAIVQPIATPAARAARIASGHAHPCSVSVTPRIAAPVPAVKPADRSISPSSRTKTRPIASTMIAAPWLRRLAKFCSVRNESGCRTPNTIARMTAPMTAGNAPRSPPLMRSQ